MGVVVDSGEDVEVTQEKIQLTGMAHNSYKRRMTLWAWDAEGMTKD